MLKLTNYFIENIKLSADINPTAPMDNSLKKLKVSVAPLFFKAQNDTQKFKVSLDITLTIEDTEFSLNFRISGFFVTDNKNNVDDYIQNKAPSILLNTARDIISSLTAKTIFGPICFPFCELSEIGKC